MIRIGIREPEWLTQDMVHLYFSDGMHYERFRGDYGRIFLAADHEDVGLVVWWEATVTEWNALVDDACETNGAPLYLED